MPRRGRDLRRRARLLVSTVTTPYLVAIDPGKWVSGVCILGRSSGTWRVLSSSEPANATRWGAPLGMAVAIVGRVRLVLGSHRPDVVSWVAEWPQSYRDRSVVEADLEILRSVVRCVGTETRCPVRHVAPRAWKGNVPKEVHHERILRFLDRDERERIEDGKESLDALGLGLWAVGRTGRGGVAP